MGNHLLYNFGVGGGAGADLYGTEPWTFYAKLPGRNSRVNRIVAMLINMMIIMLAPLRIPGPSGIKWGGLSSFISIHFPDIKDIVFGFRLVGNLD